MPGSHVETGEEVVGDHRPARRERLTPGTDDDIVDRGKPEHIGQGDTVLPHVQECRVAEGIPGVAISRLRHVTRERGHSGLDAAPPQHAQVVRFGHGQRAQQDGVDEREHRGAGADAEGNREHRHGGETWGLQEHPQAQVGYPRVDIHGKRIVLRAPSRSSLRAVITLPVCLVDAFRPLLPSRPARASDYRGATIMPANARSESSTGVRPLHESPRTRQGRSVRKWALLSGSEHGSDPPLSYYSRKSARYAQIFGAVDQPAAREGRRRGGVKAPNSLRRRGEVARPPLEEKFLQLRTLTGHAALPPPIGRRRRQRARSTRAGSAAARQPPPVILV